MGEGGCGEDKARAGAGIAARDGGAGVGREVC